MYEVLVNDDYNTFMIIYRTNHGDLWHTYAQVNNQAKAEELADAMNAREVSRGR
jgi:hypothetical protein